MSDLKTPEYWKPTLSDVEQAKEDGVYTLFNPFTLKPNSWKPEDDTFVLKTKEKKEWKQEDMDAEMKEEKKEQKEEKKEQVELIVETPRCPRCHKEVKEEWRACIGCGHYLPKPGETFDASTVSFDLPTKIGGRGVNEFVENLHMRPMPNVFGSAVSSSRELNEHVFNLLPLTEEQKLELYPYVISQEYKDEKKQGIIAERAERTLKDREDGAKALKEIRRRRKLEKQFAEQGRRGIKSSQPSHNLKPEKTQQ